MSGNFLTLASFAKCREIPPEFSDHEAYTLIQQPYFFECVSMITIYHAAEFAGLLTTPATAVLRPAQTDPAESIPVFEARIDHMLDTVHLKTPRAEKNQVRKKKSGGFATV